MTYEIVMLHKIKHINAYKYLNSNEFDIHRVVLFIRLNSLVRLII